MRLPLHYALEFNCQHSVHLTDKPLSMNTATNPLTVLEGVVV